MTPTIIQTLTAFVGAMLFINIVVAALQYWNDRSRAQRDVLIYWMANLLPAITGAYFKNANFMSGTVGSMGTFISQYILGSVLADVREVQVRRTPQILCYLGFLLLAFLFFKSGSSFEVYAFIGAAGAASPFFFHWIATLKRPRRKFSLSQKMFVFIAICLSLHYLDWGYFRVRPEIYGVGLTIAFGIFFILSILMPMIVNEHSLERRNAALGNEVERRVNQLKHAEWQLWEASKLASMGRMAGGMAHEINTPLTAIGLHAERLDYDAERGRMTPQSVKSHVHGIRSIIERISKITEGLRKVARDQASVSVERETVNLRELVHKAVETHQANLDELGIELRTEWGPKELLAYCNPIEISQVIMHLLSNSIDAIDRLEDKWILVSMREVGSFLEVSVEDSGEINSEIASRIMEPFFTTKPVGQGTGLGLSVSKSIVESHGGKLFLDQSSRKTRFVFELPRNGSKKEAGWNLQKNKT